MEIILKIFLLSLIKRELSLFFSSLFIDIFIYLKHNSQNCTDWYISNSISCLISQAVYLPWYINIFIHKNAHLKNYHTVFCLVIYFYTNERLTVYNLSHNCVFWSSGCSSLLLKKKNYMSVFVILFINACVYLLSTVLQRVCCIKFLIFP